MIQFITDSTAYLSKEMIGHHPIQIVSLSALIDEDLFVEVETENSVFYKRLEEGTSFPKSAQPTVEDMMSAFERPLLAGHDVIGTFLSSEMSGTYQMAMMVKEQLLEKYPQAKMEVIDSRTNCMQMGFCVLFGAELAAEGMTIEAVADKMKSHVKRSRFIFLPASLEYLKRGGRIGGAQALFGSILQILPILTVKEGKTEVLQKVRTKKKAVEAMVSIALEDIRNSGLDHVAVHHIEAYEEGFALARRLSLALGIPVPVIPIGPVIGTHVGPGAIAIAYDLKNPLKD